jgi:hypothetical protein
MPTQNDEMFYAAAETLQYEKCVSLRTSNPATNLFGLFPLQSSAENLSLIRGVITGTMG